jgi:hypothetical protein
MIITLSQLFLLLTMCCLSVRNHHKVETKEDKEVWHKRKDVGTGHHWTCLVLAWSAGPNWSLSGISRARWLKIIGQCGVHRTCQVRHVANDSQVVQWSAS